MCAQRRLLRLGVLKQLQGPGIRRRCRCRCLVSLPQGELKLVKERVTFQPAVLEVGLGHGQLLLQLLDLDLCLGPRDLRELKLRQPILEQVRSLL